MKDTCLNDYFLSLQAPPPPPPIIPVPPIIAISNFFQPRSAIIHTPPPPPFIRYSRVFCHNFRKSISYISTIWHHSFLCLRKDASCTMHDKKYLILWQTFYMRKNSLPDPGLRGEIPDLCLFVPCFPAFFDLLISLGQ